MTHSIPSLGEQEGSRSQLSVSKHLCLFRVLIQHSRKNQFCGLNSRTTLSLYDFQNTFKLRPAPLHQRSMLSFYVLLTPLETFRGPVLWLTSGSSPNSFGYRAQKINGKMPGISFLVSLFTL